MSSFEGGLLQFTNTSTSYMKTT